MISFGAIRNGAGVERSQETTEDQNYAVSSVRAPSLGKSHCSEARPQAQVLTWLPAQSIVYTKASTSTFYERKIALKTRLIKCRCLNELKAEPRHRKLKKVFLHTLRCEVINPIVDCVGHYHNANENDT